MHRATLNEDLLAVVSLLAADSPLPENLRDHALAEEWADYRDCMSSLTWYSSTGHRTQKRLIWSAWVRTAS